MDLKKISGRIGRLAELADGWEKEGQIDVIERDVALELLRALYSELRFAPAETQAEAIREPAAETAPAASAAVPGPEHTPATHFADEAPQETAVTPEPEAEPKAGQPEPEEETPFRTEAAADHGQLSEAVQASEADDIPSPAETEKESAEPETLPAPEPEQAGDDVPVLPRMVDPDVIRSLYGSDIHTERPAEPERREPESRQDAPAETPVGKSTEHKSIPAAHAAAETGDAAAHAVLGEVISGGRQTLGETLRNGRKDMASQIAASERPDLKRSIGLNDKFLMIRDMFGGDAEAFGEAIERLDSFTDLDEAIIYIHETYNWNADSDGVRLLVDLLERKLG